jgi:hypothetical protein
MDDWTRRADLRRRTYTSEVMSAGQPKPALRGPSFTMRRLEEMWELCVSQWLASGRPLPSFERATMPGEVFRIPW